MPECYGKHVLVTGGSKGIGRACVEEFINAGATVIATYRQADSSLESLSETHDPTQLLLIQSDATSPSDCSDLANAVNSTFTGKLHVLVNNVGDAVQRSSFEDSDDALWESSLSINLLSAVRTTRAFLPMLRASKNGVIVNISSIAATSGGGNDSLHYGVAKAALNRFTRGLSKELTHGDVRVVGVAPSAIDTDFQNRHSSRDRLEKIIDQTPLGRIGTAQEVARMVVFLSSDNAAFVSGETIEITGGR